MSIRSSLALASGPPAVASALLVAGVLAPPSCARAAMIGSGTGPRVIAVGDMNGDGVLDLVSGNSGDLMVSVSLGRGDGTFGPKEQYALDSPPTGIAVADLDQDGDLDVAVTCPGGAPAHVRIRFNAGDGTLGPPAQYSITAPVALVATNFNPETDAFMDLLIVNNPSGSTMNSLRGTGGGAFTVGADQAPFRSVHLTAGDVDGDGRPDLVFANVVDSIAVFRGSGTSAFFGFTRYRVQGLPANVTLADFDEDGNLDIAATIPAAGTVNILLGNGDGTFDPYTSFPAGASPTGIASGDFNGDGAADLAVTGGGSTVAILIGTGTGTFQPRVDYPAGVAATNVAIATLDGDANADLAVAANGSNSICTLLGNGDGTFPVPSGPVYVWGPASGSAFDPGAWLPSRGSGTPSDILVFNRGGAISVTNVPPSTVGQFVISGGTQASFSAGFFGSATLTVAGGTGDDAVIEWGSKSVLASSNTVSVNMASGARGVVHGDLEIRGGANRVQALDVDGLEFESTGRAIIGPGSSTTPFGNGTGASGLQSVLFVSGSQYVAGAPVDVFGAAAPNAVVQFTPGSRFRQTAAFAPDVSGRTYADYECDAPGTSIVLSGSGPVVLDSMIVTAGTVTVAVTGTVTIRGNVAVACGAFPGPGVLRFLPATPMTVRLAGSARQYMRPSYDCGNSEVFYLSPNVTLDIDNPTDIEFFQGFRTSANLSFSQGIIRSHRVLEHGLHRHRFAIDSTGTVTGASASTGWFACPLMRRVTADGELRMDIGDSLAYQPVDVTVHGVTAPGYFTAATAGEDHWQVATAPLDLAHMARRSWSLWAADSWLGAPATWLSSIDATLSFAPADLSAGADPLQFVARLFQGFSGPWSTSMASGNRTATSIDVALPLASLTPGSETAFLQVGEPIDNSGIDDAALAFALTTTSPNPSPAGPIRIAFALPHATDAQLTVHDVQGRTLAKLADGVIPAGRHERTWDSTRAAPGMYFVRVVAPGFHAERRVVLIR